MPGYLVPTNTVDQSTTIGGYNILQALNAGNVIQKQWYPMSTALTISDSTNYSDIMTASFTPKLANSKIFLTAVMHFGKRGTGELQFNHRFLRNGSSVTNNLTSAQNGSNYDLFRINTGIGWHSHINYYADDLPNTISPVTYKFQIIKQNPGGYDDVAINFNGAAKSVFIIEEVAV
jgi:hypothetical protein